MNKQVPMIDLQDLLPKRTAELIQVVGFEAAMVLVKQFGGTHLNIPKKAKQDHQLLAYLRIETLEKLCHYYGGTKLEIDLCSHIINQQKQQLILTAIAAGHTNAQLARQFNTTERNIRRIKQLSRCMPQVVNLDIFDCL
jgi:N-acetylglucosamine-6-phosphate deacetylase